MPCDNPQHNHIWPTSGNLIIERCEVYCQFCGRLPRTGEYKFWLHGWQLRRHVYQIHEKKRKMPIKLQDGWTGVQGGTKDWDIHHDETSPNFVGKRSGKTRRSPIRPRRPPPKVRSDLLERRRAGRHSVPFVPRLAPVSCRPETVARSAPGSLAGEANAVNTVEAHEPLDPVANNANVNDDSNNQGPNDQSPVLAHIDHNVPLPAAAGSNTYGYGLEDADAQLGAMLTHHNNLHEHDNGVSNNGGNGQDNFYNGSYDYGYTNVQEDNYNAQLGYDNNSFGLGLNDQGYYQGSSAYNNGPLNTDYASYNDHQASVNGYGAPVATYVGTGLAPPAPNQQPAFQAPGFPAATSAYAPYTYPPYPQQAAQAANNYVNPTSLSRLSDQAPTAPNAMTHPPAIQQPTAPAANNVNPTAFNQTAPMGSNNFLANTTFDDIFDLNPTNDDEVDFGFGNPATAPSAFNDAFFGAETPENAWDFDF
ncbi:hypothetical protein MBLNU230_g2847t1 [Neophaeotheca triangularis]